MESFKRIIVFVGIVALTGCMTPRGSTVIERQTSVQQMKTDTLAELYAQIPKSEAQIERAVGYGVFKKVGTALLVGGTANGFGTITEKATGKETYMRAATGSLGFGLGIKNFRLVIVFYDPEVMNQFVNTGWDFGAQASATLKSEGEGGDAVASGTIKRTMDIYEFTEEGIFLRADIKATRFWPDKSLNID